MFWVYKDYGVEECGLAFGGVAGPGDFVLDEGQQCQEVLLYGTLAR